MNNEIIVDARMVRNSGIGVYIRNILPLILKKMPETKFTVYISEQHQSDISTASNVKYINSNMPIYSIAEQFFFRRRKSGKLLYWVPHYNMPIFSSVDRFVTVHDVAHIACKEARGGIHRQLYAFIVLTAVKLLAKGIFFVSDATKNEFETYIGKPKAKTFITSNAASPQWFNFQSSINHDVRRRSNYIIYVGNVKPHKNLISLVKAFDLLKHINGVRLLIVGKREGFLLGDGAIAAAVGQSSDSVHFTGEVSDAELMDLVANARAMVFPSLYEGFGIPPLEAMTVGCPVVASDIPSLRETCLEAAEYIDPYDIKDIARGIEKVLLDEAYAVKLIEAGMLRSRDFSYSKTADIIISAFREYFNN